MRLVDHHLAGTGDAEHGCQPESAVNDLVGELRALGLGSFASRSAIFPGVAATSTQGPLLLICTFRQAQAHLL